MTLRIYLTGRVSIEVDGRLVVNERRFRGRQARVAFAYLVFERARPATREELADIIWSDEKPPAWEVALSALISRMRTLLSDRTLGLEQGEISRGFGQYQIHLPVDTWIDTEVASCALDEAEKALRSEHADRAWGPAWAAVSVYRRPFLSGDDGEWVMAQRRKLQRQLLRSLDCFTQVCLATGDPGLAVETATEAIAIDPYRETGHQLLMRAYETAGDRAGALRTYGELRSLLVDELGADPSPETEALYLQLLG